MPGSLFIFIKNTISDLIDVKSIVVDLNGEVLHSYKNRQLDRLQELNKQYPLIVILPGTTVNAHYIDLPTLKKSELMVPNILEESLVTSIDDMHFALDVHKNSNNKYLVYSIKKSCLDTLIKQLKDLSLQPSSISSILLPHLKDTLLAGEEDIQLITESSCGVMMPDTLSTLQQDLPKSTPLLTFNNSNTSFRDLAINRESIEKNETYQAYIAKQHMLKPGLNLLQGAYKIKQNKTKAKYFMALSLLAFSLLFFITTNLIQYQGLKSSLKTLKQDNFKRYKKVFPQASSMISPYYRIKQWLNDSSQNSEQPFFQISHKISPLLYKQKNLTLLSINFQNNQLTITFKLPNFEALNKLQQQFEKNNISVNQLSALTEQGEINAVWRLSK